MLSSSSSSRLSMKPSTGYAIVLTAVAVAILLALGNLLGRAGDARANATRSFGVDRITALIGGHRLFWLGRGDGSITGLSPGAGQRAVVRRSAGSFVYAFTSRRNNIWALTDVGVFRIEPTWARVSRFSAEAQSKYYDIAATSHGLWLVAGKGQIVRLTRGSIVRRYRVPGQVVRVFALDDQLWTIRSNRRGRLTGPSGSWLMERLSPSTGALKAPSIPLSCLVVPVKQGFTIWLANACRGLLAPYSVRTGRIGTPVRLPGGAVTAVLSLHGGQMVAATGENGSIWLVDTQLRRVQLLKRVGAGVTTLAITSGGTILAATDRNQVAPVKGP